MKPASPARAALRAAPPRRAVACLAPETRIEGRERVADALRACSAREQIVLGLLLHERLTAAEAAEALGLSPRQVSRAYHAALADLRRALGRGRRGRLSRAIARRSLAIDLRSRKAA